MKLGGAFMRVLRPNGQIIGYYFFSRTFFPAKQAAVPAARSSTRPCLRVPSSRASRTPGQPGGLLRSRTHPSGVCSSPVGCAGACQQRPNSVEAKVCCNVHPSCPHHRRAHPARAAARSARAGSAVARGCGRGRAPRAPIAARTTRFCGPGPASSG